MRFHLQLTLDKPELPIEYRRLILSYIKHCLSKVQEIDLMSQFYHGTAQKDFTWSIEMNQPQFEPNKVVLADNRIRLNFAASDQGMVGFVLFQVFLAQKHQKFVSANYEIRLDDVKQDKEHIITANSCMFRTSIGSPICVRIHQKESNKNTYLTFQDSNFSDYIVSVLKEIAEMKGFSKEERDTITFQWLTGKKVLIKHYNHIVDSSIGAYIISGPPPLLQMLYQTGILSRKSEGFGMVDLIAQQDVEKA